MDIGSYIGAGIFAIIIAAAVWGHFDLSFIWQITKMALRVLLVVPFAVIGICFFSLFGSELVALVGLAAGVVAGATAPIWWKKFHWKGRLISALVVAGAFLLLCGAYLTPLFI